MQPRRAPVCGRLPELRLPLSLHHSGELMLFHRRLRMEEMSGATRDEEENLDREHDKKPVSPIPDERAMSRVSSARAVRPVQQLRHLQPVQRWRATIGSTHSGCCVDALPTKRHFVDCCVQGSQSTRSVQSPVILLCRYKFAALSFTGYLCTSVQVSMPALPFPSAASPVTTSVIHWELHQLIFLSPPAVYHFFHSHSQPYCCWSR